mgnify:CR=1 FL=1|tara:strand:+ start:3542 stop:4843 length:1302 start_codon:yes stop_codon:yes gene_type:complete
MSTQLGDQAIVGRLLADNIGLPAKHVNTIYVDNIVPTPVSAPETLQATMTAGNETTLPLKIASTVDMYNIADTAFATNIVKLSTDPVLSNGGSLVVSTKASDPDVLEEHTVFRAADKAIFMKGNIIIDADGDEVQIGKNGDNQPLGGESVSIGENAGTNGTTGSRAVNIGWSAGRTNCGSRSVAIGDEAGEFNTGFGAVSIGTGAGENGTGDGAVCIGRDAGTTLAGTNAVVIGNRAAATAGNNSVMIGAEAGGVATAANSIVINATGSVLNDAGINTLVIDPVRNAPTDFNSDDILHRDPLNGEIYQDRIRYAFKTNILTGAATFTLDDTTSSIQVFNWVSGSGIASVFLPNTADVPLGTYVMIKNFSQTAGQSVIVNPALGSPDTIDKAGTSIELDSTTRAPTGGGGSCIEVMKVRVREWIITRGYNQIFG